VVVARRIDAFNRGYELYFSKDENGRIVLVRRVIY
jgi:hypothetical protein